MTKFSRKRRTNEEDGRSIFKVVSHFEVTMKEVHHIQRITDEMKTLVQTRDQKI